MNALERLIVAHPRLFRGGRAPRVTSYLLDGWYPIVDKLCTDIDEVLGSAGRGKLEVEQIKEKFGALRFYYSLKGASDPVNKRVRELVRQAELASRSVCEQCGEAGELHDDIGDWHVTLCEAHLAELKAKRQQRTT